MSDFKIKVTADLDTSQVEAKLMALRKWHKMQSGKEISQVLMERHPLLEGKLDL